jgi:NAD(P)-dependent dehydrogenase (short-subunit alcohol dehydrogenase family)
MPMLEPVNCRILITGATGAIGGALAEVYAAPGRRTAPARSKRRKNWLPSSARCVALGATRTVARASMCDDTKALHGWLDEVCATDALDLVIVNAGMNTDIGPAGQGEPWDEAEAVLSISI